MAFALTSFFADGQKFQGPGMYRATQRVVFTITGTSADIDLDIGDFSGTFWTAALANTTYGEMATQVKAQLTTMENLVLAVSKIYTPELADRIQAATASGTAYTLSIDSTTQLPIYGFDTAQGETSYTVFVEYLLKSNTLPVNLNYNIA